MICGSQSIGRYPHRTCLYFSPSAAALTGPAVRDIVDPSSRTDHKNKRVSRSLESNPVERHDRWIDRGPHHECGRQVYHASRRLQTSMLLG